MTAPQPAPGWYPDPSGSGRQAWWDGSAWTIPDQLPFGALAPPPRRRPHTWHPALLLIAAISLAMTVLPAGFALLAGGRGGALGGVLWLLWGGFWTVLWFLFARGRG